MLHDAVAVAIAQYGKSVTSAHVATLAQELLAISTNLENQIREGNTPKQTITKATAPPAIVESKKAEPEPSFDTLDDLDSIEIDL